MGLFGDCVFCVFVGGGVLFVSCYPGWCEGLDHADMIDSSPIPEITDADMEFQDEEANAASDQSFWKQYRLFHAAFAQ